MKYHITHQRAKDKLIWHALEGEIAIHSSVKISVSEALSQIFGIHRFL